MTENEYISAVRRNNQRLFVLAFLKLWKHSEEFESPEHMDKWLTRVCINDCKNNLSLFFRRQVPIDEIYDLSSFDKHFNIDLFNAVSSLNKKERLCIILFYYDDLTTRDIAALLNTKESTIKSILRRSREKLKQKLGDEWIYEQ